MKIVKTASTDALAGLLICVFLMAFPSSGAQAQIVYVDVDRTAQAEVFSETDDFDFASSQDAGFFGVDASTSGPPGTSAVASASQNLLLTQTGLQASGSYSAVTSTDCCTVGAGASTNSRVSIFYQGISDRAFTVTGSISQSGGDPLLGTATVIALGQGFHVTDSTETFSFSGHLLSGRTYIVEAGVVGTAGAQLEPDGVSGQSSSGSFNIEVEFATTEIDCNNGLDDDGDTLIDDDDPDCAEPPPPEVCDNGIDDDLDGLTDGDDPDCIDPVGLHVRCLHVPIYPQQGEQVRIVAVATDEEGLGVNAETIEIVQGRLDNIAATAADTQLADYNFVPERRFSYGCRVRRGNEVAVSWPTTQRLKLVDVGPPEQAIVDEYSAVPIGINGSVKQALDVVLLHDKDQYTGFNDPLFIEHVTNLVNEGIFRIPWFVENQGYFNIWLGTADDAEAKPRDTSGQFCDKKKPSKFKKRYGYADAAGIIHKSGPFSCRAKAGLKVFTVEHDSDNLQVIAHELGHALFYMSDEYCGSTNADGKCKAFRFSTIYNPATGFVPPYPNLYPGEALCRSEALNDGYDPDACRNLNVAQITPEFWLREPDYNTSPRVDQVRDLMQQTGAFNDGVGDADEAYGVNASERERMDWVIRNCKAEDC